MAREGEREREGGSLANGCPLFDPEEIKLLIDLTNDFRSESPDTGCCHSKLSKKYSQKTVFVFKVTGH